MSGSCSCRRLVAAAMAGGLVVALAACAGSSSGSGTVAASSAPATSTPATGAHGPATGSTVTAVETEFSISLARTSLPAGTYTFVARNVGEDTHALTVNGPGVDNKSTGDIDPGSSKSVTVTLAKGSYDVYCPVANHKMLGMDTTVTVT